jgi:hypothetical protein
VRIFTNCEIVIVCFPPNGNKWFANSENGA